MQRGAFVVVSLIVIFFVTVINYSLTGDSAAGSRTHGGTTIFLPGSGSGSSSGWHK